MRRTNWDELSDDVRDAIQSLTGPVLSERTVTEGLNSALAVVLHTSTGLVFIKGLRTDHLGWSPSSGKRWSTRTSSRSPPAAVADRSRWVEPSGVRLHPGPPCRLHTRVSMISPRSST